MGGRRTAVVDVETTGLYNTDRIVEVAVVVLDGGGNVVDEYDTLVDPQRDVGPTDLHGITATMVSAAPTFEEIAAALAARLDGAVLVAHNLTFDVRMLRNEFERVGARLLPGDGLCTLETTGERLSVACERFEIPLTMAHRALCDARATAQLLMELIDEAPELPPARVEALSCPLNPRTLRREAIGGATSSVVTRLVDKGRYPTSDGAMLSYLDALDWALDDLIITEEESTHLRALSTELGLRADDVRMAHRRYFESVIAGAMKDGIITAEEHRLMNAVGTALGVEGVTIPEVTRLVAAPSAFPTGVRICFTGSAVNSNGKKIPRSDLEAAAAGLGFQPVRSVTKRSCDMLVAADPCSASGKAKKARGFGIPIMSVLQFCEKIGFESAA